MSKNQQKVVYDIIHGNIELSNLESLMMKNPIVNRLHQILQNSAAYTVYPNMKTSRFEHSLGTMNYAGKIYKHGFINSEINEDFLDHIKSIIVDLISDGDNIFSELDNDGKLDLQYKTLFFNKVFKNLDVVQIFNSKKYNEYVRDQLGNNFLTRNLGKKLKSSTNLIIYQVIRLHALLHDVGHLPLSHLFEFSIKNVFDRLSDKEDKNETETLYHNKIKSLLNSGGENKESDEIHERIGKLIIKYILSDIRQSIINDDKIDEETKSVNLFTIFVLEQVFNEAMKGVDGKLKSTYLIVAGTIDADRLDYVQRDGLTSGIAKSSGNIDRIVKMFCLGKIQRTDEFIFMPSIQSLNDIEEMLHHRYRIYKFVVNHHAVKRMDYLFQRVIENKLLKEIENGDIPNGTGSDKLLLVIDVADGLLDSSKKYEKQLNFISLTDYWLHSILNSEFLEIATLPEDDKLQSTILREVYQNKREFKSLWKRGHEFNEFLEQLAVKISETHNETDISTLEGNLKPILEKCFSLLEKYKKFEEKGIINSEENNSSVKIPLSIEDELIEMKGYFVQLGRIVLTEIYETEKRWSYHVEKNINKELCGDLNLLMPLAKIKTGIKPQFLIDKKNQTQIFNLSHFSSIENSINLDMNNSIIFFVFYKAKGSYTKREISDKIIDELLPKFEKVLTLKNQ